MTERRAKVLELSIKGMRQSKIAEMLGVSWQTVHKDLKAVNEQLRQHAITNADELRQMKMLELQSLRLEVNRRLSKKGLTDTSFYKGISTLLKINERECKLLGLDMPQRVDITSNGETIQKRIEIVDVQQARHTDDQDDKDREEGTDAE